jgi:hypothetical protein
MMVARANVELDLLMDGFKVYLADVGPNHSSVVAPVDLVFMQSDPYATFDPAFRLRSDLARALFDALGAALGVYTPDARMAAETLKLEQTRVDKLIDRLIQ